MMCVTIKYDPLWLALEWAKANCPSYVINDFHQDGYNTYDTMKIDYFFADKEDVLLFTLRWA